MHKNLKIAIGLFSAAIGALITYDRSQEVIETVENRLSRKKEALESSDD